MKIRLTQWFSSLKKQRQQSPAWSATPDADDDTLKAALFSSAQMAQYGKTLAQSHKLSATSMPYHLTRRLAENEAVITRHCSMLSAADKASITPAGEWLLDNYYLIEEQIRLVRHHLPKDFGKGLPVLLPPRHRPRIYDIATEIIAHGDGRWDKENLSHFIVAYQEVTPLTLGELWALPGMLRLALIENLRRVSIEVANTQQARQLAERWVTKLVACAEQRPSELVMMIADLARSRPPLTSAFVAELVRRLQGRGNLLMLPLTWLEQQLADNGTSADALTQRFSQQLAAQQLSVSNSINGLRLLSETHWADFTEAMSLVDRTLQQDPAGVYPEMHFDTRDHYRHVIEMLARHSRYSEGEIAQQVLALARAADASTTAHHVGYYLIGDGRARLEQQLATDISWMARLRDGFNQIPLLSWLGSLSLLTTAFTAHLLLKTHEQGMGWTLWLLAVPLMLVASQLATFLLSEATTRCRTPTPLPRMDFSREIPAAFSSMVVIPCLLTSRESISKLLKRLEVCYLANTSAHLYFALLTDFVDSTTPDAQEHNDLLAWADAQTRELNHRYARDGDPVFYLLHRAPAWNPKQGVWMGYERKRGKLALLNRWLRHPEGQFAHIVGNVTGPVNRIKYVITLDCDTVLPRDTAHKLVATLAHPLNQPKYDPASQRVIEGYGILQPGMAEEIPRYGQGRYATLFSGAAGNDPYTMMSSDIYQDLFGEGSFVGKGIYDVDTFVTATQQVCPEDLVLSHDLLEGCYARSGLVSDVLLYEQYPNHYLADVARRTRWIRGDWQLLNWLKPQVMRADGSHSKNPLSLLSRWKLFDNLRRSLVPPAFLTLLFCALLAVPNHAYWLSALTLTVLLPTLLSTFQDIISKPRRRPFEQHVRLVIVGARQRLLRMGVEILTLPHRAGYSLHAIAITLWRLGVSRRNLNQWTTFAQCSAQRDAAPGRFYRAMWLNVAMGVALPLLSAQLAPMLLVVALPLGALWCLTPLLLSWMSREPQRQRTALNAKQQRRLRQNSREIWAFFETFVTADDNWLPPDNYQQAPHAVIAHRTSPTNIGLSLMATLTAWDFGYLPLEQALTRIADTLDTLDKLEHYRGHLYNWYDTRTLAPLAPRYISSVDSGNMAGHLLTLHAAMRALRHQPVFDAAQVVAGLDDTLRILVRHWGRNAPTTLRQMQRHCTRAAALAPAALLGELLHMRDLACRLLNLCPADEEPVRRWVERLHHQLSALCDAWSALLGWLPEDWGDAPLPSLSWLAQASPAGSGTPSETTVGAAQAQLSLMADIEQRLHQHAQMDFAFLYNVTTNRLSVGFSVENNMLDSSHYDLLPSEIRLTSFVAIASNQLPVKSWAALGRLFTKIDNETALMSWSGSMFEYLMPNLVMPTYPGSLLEKMSQSAVERQIRWGRERGVPWGISESGYYAFDASQNYQYHAFGVPGLGLRRGLADDTVIAPYATLMALMNAPDKACDNLARLKKLGAHGEYGFYEALDYTPSRLANGQSHAIVRSWMAHHQGMAFQALSYVLLGAPMVERFMSSAAFQSARLLLQERVPEAIELYSPRRHFDAYDGRLKPAQYQPRRFHDADTLLPEVQLLANHDYHLMVTQSGGGYSRWRDIALTRWRSDTTCDNWGSYCYLSDPQSGEVWNTTWQADGDVASHYDVIFTDAGAEFTRKADSLRVKTHIVVSPEDDIELRRITLLHRGRHPRTIALTTYAEVVLAPMASDLAHPAFSNLFVQTELVPDKDAILCHRRPRAPEERGPWLFHMAVVRGQVESTVSFDTDRAAFLGRGHIPATATALHQPGPLSNSAGAVLDPILAIRQCVVLQPGVPVTIDVFYGVTESRTHSQALMEKYRDRPIANRIFELASSHSHILLRQINANEDDAALFNRLASAVLFPVAELRAEGHVITRNRRGQSGLWGWGISGDLPIVLLTVTSDESMALITTLIQAHHYWRLKGLKVDMVILNTRQGGYQQELHHRIINLITACAEGNQIDKPGGIFVRNAEQLSAEDRLLLMSVAHILLDDRAGDVATQLSQKLSGALPPQTTRAARVTLDSAHYQPWYPDTHNLQFFNGLGGFSADGREYHVVLNQGDTTPAPWSNVLANAQFGSVISEAGQAYTWYENAHEYRLTPWENDPISDRSGESFYLRDEESGAVWSPTTLPVRGQGAYLSRHGFGYSVFAHRETGIDSELTVLVALEAPVKLAMLTLHNRSGRTRKLSATGYVEWVLGVSRLSSALHVVTRPASVHQGCGILATNHYGSNGSEQTAFFAVSGAQCTFTADRREFLGRNGSRYRPAAMAQGALSEKTGAGFDPCAAVQSVVTLIDGDRQTLVFALGIGNNPQEAEALIASYLNETAAQSELADVHRYWHQMLDTVIVNTPDAAVNLLANGWLLYQTLACRIMARSGYYQSGGAFGFRDQLQDTLALSHAAPERLRDQLLLCASRQFIEGDVQHWWHPPLGNGVRTRCSDDYLWLPLALCHYVETTGDLSLLEQAVPYLEGRQLLPGEESAYEQPVVSAQSETLWQHCVRAIEHGLATGRHGLPLMGAGDWNDGMNLVGLEGKGESVWLAFFLYDILQRFSALAERRQEHQLATRCREHAAELQQNIEIHAWDGAWYRRGYFDNGEPLGSHLSTECQIDAIAQSWSVLSGAGNPQRCAQAIKALDTHLVNQDAGFIQLLTPPFNGNGPNPGYIQGYVPGVRENGGQYTHGAIWAIMAFAQSGNPARAWELWSLINPINHSLTPQATARYKVEPYVMTADIYSVEPHTGRGGWSWYTGSAGWAYRLIVETLLGVTRHGDALTIATSLPHDWPSASLSYQFGSSRYDITLRNSSGEYRLTLDGTALPPGKIPLIDDGQPHQVDIALGDNVAG
ncbi:cyclic beta 1-2 glucan synthetase [Candidatus Symbiopectobacterium sp. NZEC127]|uniref:glycoside hydrolase family 94 protein n=1 Tax=Candidatus Symbiopectobacterium sp. NZEC127 TaxID=2820472 RepID=UPI0022266811|nr:glycoside hydrolase family 94 protein [Candidatus Symbiopectobacterium sp. NZEC127]MCW2485231.1 cyclic beta 1-2 glucan synthetase [Candidatus Symbiopectobacterium sp. NZEC127]